LKCSDLAIKRLVLFFSMIFYAFSVHYAHTGYLADQHHVPFFEPGVFGFIEFAAVSLFIGIAVMIMPLRISNVSSVFLIILLCFLYLPVLVISLGHSRLEMSQTLSMVIASGISYFLINIISKVSHNANSLDVEQVIVLSRWLVALWGVACVIFCYVFWEIMSFRGLDEIYLQREMGQASNRASGYLQIYFGYFLSVVLFACGIYLKSKIYIIIGLIGCVLLYMVTAERTVFMLPLLVYAVHYAAMRPSSFVYIFSFFLIASAAVFVSVELFYRESPFFYDLGFYYLARVVAIPGVFYEQYYGFFNSVGFTNYSHVTVLSNIFSPDTYFQGDPFYPQLGKIVARDVHHINSNSNASFLATDGAAAFGFLGVLLISLLLSIYLLLLDYLSNGWPLAFIAPAISPLAFVLTNGSVFTVLLSFGGLLWLLILILFKAKKTKKQGN